MTKLERMVSNGDETENEKAEQQPVGASPQHQQHQVGKSEAHNKPGSNGWGTCAELLLVSAVRKHGPLNWKLVALELKARALLLNSSPSCFSEEACRGKYNVLKGKFASTSNMGDAVGFDGGVLVEELRKLRMSDLKQELQQYDSSIRHLQSKIRKMKDDRTQIKNHSSVKQQGGESTKAQKAFESKPPVARKLDGPSNRAAGSIDGKSHAQPEPLLEARSSPPFEIADRSQIPEDGNPKGTEVQPPSTSKMAVKDLNDELQHAGESSSLRKSAPGQSHEHGKPRSVVRGEGEFRVPSARDQEQGRDSLEKKNRPPVNVRPHQVSRTASGKGEKDKEKVRNSMTSFDTSEQADVAVLAHDVSPSPRAETEDLPAASQVADGKESQKLADVKTPVEGRSRNDLPRDVGRSSEAEAVLRQQEADSTAAESGVKKDGVSQKPPTISYGRSVTKNRSKLSDDGRTSAHESRFVSGSASKSQQQVGELQNERSKLLSKVPTPAAEQMVEKGKAVGPSEDIVTGSAKGGSESAVIVNDSQEAEDKLVELKDLSDLRKHSVHKSMESKDGKEGKKASGQNKSAGSSRESSDNRKLANSSKALGSKGGTEEKKQIDNRTLGAAEAAGDEKKHSSMNKRTGNNNNSSSREISGDKKFECGSSSSSKVVETSRDIADGKKTMSINKLVNMDLSKDKKLGSSSSSKTSEPRDVYDAKRSMGSDGLPDGERRDGRNIQSPNISPTPSASGGGDAFPEARRPDGSRARKRSESPQVNFPEGVAADENRSPHLLQGISTEQKAAASNTDASQKQKRLESGKAVASSERERKRKAAALKPSPSGVTPEGRPAKRQWEEKPKTAANMDTNFNSKERKLGTKPKKIIADDEVSDLVYKRENGDLQEESRDFLESGERHVDYDNSQTTEKLEVASSMDSIEDTSPSGRKSRKDPKIPGKFLPLLECLRVICAHKSAPLFRQRQEYQEKRSYNLLVRRHVDLGMIRSRLEEGAYSSSVEFFRDLLLVFTNALVYNSKDSQEYSGAKVLRSYALAEMDKILQTEALLKQHGPATRKREVRKSKEVPQNRGGSTGSAGTEVRKKATGKPTGEGADVEVAQQRTGSVDNSQRVDGDEEEREVEGGSETIKKPTPNRVMKEENQRREAPKAPKTPKIELNTEGNKNSSQPKSKNLKIDSAAQPPKSLRESEAARPSQSGHVDNLESTVEFPSRLKDMTSVEEGVGQKLSGGIHSRPPQPAKHASASRSGTSTARGSRYSKRAGESSASNSKKRSRK